MTTRHFCTYFDHNYLPRGMVMLESLHEHCPEAHAHVLCLSDECHAALDALAYPHVSLIRLSDIEAADPELAAVRSSRGLVEYYFTMTSCLPWFLLTGQGLDEITYLDADMMFFSSPEPLFEEAEGASVIITPHRFSSHLRDREVYGLYNVSWMTFRNTTDGKACLAWYRDACLEWCCDRAEAGRYADQKYLEYFGDKFSGVHAMSHCGGGVAPWNLKELRVGEEQGRVLVNNEPLIFYHAQGFKHIGGPFYSSGLLGYYVHLDDQLKKNIFLPYVERYAAAAARATVHTGLKTFKGIRGPTGQRLFAQVEVIASEWKNKTLLCLL